MFDGITFPRWLMHFYFLLRRPVTLGVRAIVVNEKNEVLLVRHGYVEGWYLPGGGVEIGETAEQAASKELREEANVITEGEGVLCGVYYNRRASKRDHVVLYRFSQWQQPFVPKPNAEIRESGFFALDALPEGTTGGTRQRLLEEFDDAPRDAFWS